MSAVWRDPSPYPYASLAYGYGDGSRHTALIYDLGGGEVGGHGDDGLLRQLAQGRARPFRQLAQNQRGNLRRREITAAHHHSFRAAHAALDASHRAFGIQRLLVARRLAHQQLAGSGEPDA